MGEGQTTQEEDEGCSITLACQIVGVSRSGYYRRRYGESKAGQYGENLTVDEETAEIIREIIKEYPTYGYRRVWAILRFDKGVSVNKKKVQRITQIKGWQAKPIKRPSRSKGRRYEVVDPKGKIEVSFPNLRWSTDLTKFYVEEVGWVNLIPVIDCCTRECVGKRISVRGRAREAKDALEDAVLSRFGTIQNLPPDLVLRMDNGSIFLSKEYWSELKRLGIKPEFSPYNCPSANGIVERFIKTFKEECAWQHTFKTLREAEEVINNWIEFYNTKRRHSSLGYKTPLEYHQNLRKLAA